ncbi:MAG: chemotaxis protein CheA, partial [Thermoguttaceae bacterium]|nr:chemotaxis protein CheA [Thermoguttaceae bacterium]
SHRIKGSAASIGLNRGAKLAHLMEDVLQNLLESGGALSPELTDAMLKCSDALRQYVDSLRTGSGNCEQFTQRAQDLLAAQQLRTEREQPGPRGAASPETGPAAGAAARLAGECREDLLRHMPAGMRGCIGQVAFQPGLALVGLKARLVYEKLAAQGEVRAIFPPVEQLDEIEELDCLTFALAGDHPADFIRRQIWVAGVREILIEPVHGQDAGGPPAMASQPPGAQPAAPATPVASAAKPSAERPTPGTRTKDPASDSSGKPAETLRVDIDRLDQLMNLAGQLVINKARFAQIADRLRGALGMKRSVDVLSTVTTVLESMSTAGQNADSPQALEAELELLRSQARRIQAALEPIRRDVDSLNHARNTVNELFEAVHQLERVSDGIQQSVMDTRMVPIGPLFTRFKRVVRDITRVNGRSIRLVIQGEKTELDKRMIDELGDPLIHMVRNSADHGIEPPEVRTAAGKPAEGTITLDAFHRGNHIVIQVRDDGRGLNRERILQKALDRGLVTAADAERMTPQQVFQLIWEPGLSTAERVTEVSGRGMGMDIVKSKIEDLNGSVELDSVPGQGTTITIKLPLTLAIMPSLMVEIQSVVFAMPMESVVEIVALKRQD